MSFCQNIKKGHGRPKSTWIEKINKDMKKLGLSVDIVYEKI